MNAAAHPSKGAKEPMGEHGRAMTLKIHFAKVQSGAFKSVIRKIQRSTFSSGSMPSAEWNSQARVPTGRVRFDDISDSDLFGVPCLLLNPDIEESADSSCRTNPSSRMGNLCG